MYPSTKLGNSPSSQACARVAISVAMRDPPGVLSRLITKTRKASRYAQVQWLRGTHNPQPTEDPFLKHHVSTRHPAFLELLCIVLRLGRFGT